MPHRFRVWALCPILVAIVLMHTERARACGCVVSSNTATPVVQAGERLLFAIDNGVVTAHIQIQYQGAAEDFAWLVPVPKVPELRIGTDEVFTALEANTAPQFVLTTLPALCAQATSSGGGGLGCGEDASIARNGASDSGAAPYQPVPDIAVLKATAGPYEYAVLRADDKAEILAWLQANRYFVPTDTDSVLDPYVHPGAYFLALKLRAGESTGSIRPVILQYESDFPMIPIVLTSIAATPDMGILVWIAGEARAIPRNYQHVVINEGRLNWQTQADNYGALVKAAIDEATDHHAFVTEYVGASNPISAAINSSRFPSGQALLDEHDRARFLQALRAGFVWDEITPTLKRHFAKPASLSNVNDVDFYASLEHYLGLEDPQPTNFDPTPVVDDIWAEVVRPVVESDLLFQRHPKLTRLYTVLSPEEMTVDPAFSFNADLPDISNVHRATFYAGCDGNPTTTLEDGRQFLTADVDRSGAPLLARLELLREEGPPMVLVDNLDDQTSAPQPGEGCTSATRPTQGAIDLALIFGAVWIGSRVRSRRR